MRSGLQHLSLFVCGALLLTPNAGVGRAEKSFTDYPAAAQSLYKQAEQWFGQGRFREALDAYERAGRQGMRDYPLLDVQRGECLRQLKEYAKAIETLSRSIEEGTL